jgi:glycine cleavage system H protein
VNGDLEDSPTLVNEDATGGGWFAKLEISDSSEIDSLMDEEAYKAYVEGLD